MTAIPMMTAEEIEIEVERVHAEQNRVARWNAVYGAMVANRISAHVGATLRGVTRGEMNRIVFDAKDTADLAEESWDKVIEKKP